MKRVIAAVAVVAVITAIVAAVARSFGRPYVDEGFGRTN